MAFGKRQLVLASLVVALGAAVYLNWQFSGNNDLMATTTAEATRELGEAQYVNNAQVESKADGDGSAQPENKENTNASQDYFKKARENRQNARNAAAETVKEILNDVKSSEAAKAEAIKQAADIAKVIQQESNIENLVKAKGFEECVAFIQNNECSIVVSPKGLDAASVITIKDIVAGQAGVPYDKIKIMEAK